MAAIRLNLEGAVMQQHGFGCLAPVSRLTLGGGGLGMLWGETNFAECVAPVEAALASGITLFDLALELVTACHGRTRYRRV